MSIVMAMAAVLPPPPSEVSEAHELLGRLYARHHQELFRYAQGILRHGQDAQDVLQAAMAAALVALLRGVRPHAPRAWLFRIVHNEAITVLRRRPALADLPHETAAPADDEDAAGRCRQVLADLQHLPEQQRAALLLRELHGLSFEEVAGVLRTSPGNARQAAFKARAALIDLQDGREMACQPVRDAIGHGDGRALRRRTTRAHLRSCEACRTLESAMRRRRADLALLPLLPAAVAERILGAVAGDAAATATLGLSGAAAASTVGSAGATVVGGGATLTAVLAKGLVVIVAAAGGTALAVRGAPTPESRPAPAVLAAEPATAAPPAALVGAPVTVPPATPAADRDGDQSAARRAPAAGRRREARAPGSPPAAPSRPPVPAAAAPVADAGVAAADARPAARPAPPAAAPPVAASPGATARPPAPGASRDTAPAVPRPDEWSAPTASRPSEPTSPPKTGVPVVAVPQETTAPAPATAAQPTPAAAQPAPEAGRASDPATTR